MPDHPLHAARRASLRPLLVTGLFSVAVNLLVLTGPLYMMQVFDRVLASRSVDTLIYLTAVALFALAALAAFDLARGRLLLGLGEWVEARLAPAVFDRMLAGALDGRTDGQESLRDLATLRTVLGSTSMAVLFDAPWAPVFIAATWLLHPLLGAISLSAAALLFAIALGNELATRAPLREAARSSGAAASAAAASARGVEAADAMGMSGALLRRWFAINAAALRSGRRAGNRATLLTAISKFVRLAVQVVLMGAGAWLVVQHELTGGAMMAASIMMSRALAPVEQAIGMWRQVSGARIAFGRLKDLLDQPGRPQTSVPLPAPAGLLTVERLTWAPAGTDRFVLRGVDFGMEPGEALAIVGPSGAGKSSLARLIVGLRRPSSGSIRLDGAEMGDRPRDEIGRHVGYLPQDVSLLPGTIAENIARMSRPIDPQAVVAAAMTAGVHEMILRLPQGYDTLVGERDAILSGGQRQRIALARALYGQPQLLVLDEPNANLDSEGEQALGAAVRQAKSRGSTVILISHRPSLIAHADRILVLREGRLEMLGPKAQVLERIRPRPEAVVRPVHAMEQLA